MLGIRSLFQLAGILDGCNMHVIATKHLRGIEFRHKSEELIEGIRAYLLEEISLDVPLLWKRRARGTQCSIQINSLIGLSWLLGRVGSCNAERMERVESCLDYWEGSLAPVRTYDIQEEEYRREWMRGWILSKRESGRTYGCFGKSGTVNLKIRIESPLEEYLLESLGAIGVRFQEREEGHILIEEEEDVDRFVAFVGEEYIGAPIEIIKKSKAITEAVALYKEGLSPEEIGRENNVHKSRIKARLESRGYRVEREKTFTLSEEELKAAYELIEGGISGREVLRRMGKNECRSHYLYKQLKGAGYNLSCSHRLQRRRRLEEEDYKRIAHLHQEEGRGITDIVVNELGLPKSRAGQIAKNMRERGYTLNIASHSSPYYRP